MHLAIDERADARRVQQGTTGAHDGSEAEEKRPVVEDWLPEQFRKAPDS